MAASVLPVVATGPSHERLGNALLALRESGAHHFDPPRFRFIEAMLQRAGRLSEPVASVLLERAEAALAAYQQQLLQAREEVSQSVITHAEQFPQAAARLQQLLAEGKLCALQRLATGLQRERDRQRPLGELLDRLEQRGEPASICPAADGLDDMLLQQEQQALAATSAGAGEAAPPIGAAGRDLRAARWLRKSRAGRRSRELLAEARQGCHEHAGPLNPEMLAIRSLQALHKLSPAYLQQMISYIDTVFALQGCGPGAGYSPAGRRGGVKQRSRIRD
jgi:hypothetical protein